MLDYFVSLRLCPPLPALGAKRRLVQTALSAPYFLRYPLYVTCANPAALEGSNYPLFLFSKTGALLHEPLPAQAVHQIAGVSQHLISSLILYLIRQPVQAQGLIRKDQARTPKDMALEGRRIIEVASGVPTFELFEPEFPLLESILSHVPPHKAPEFWSGQSLAGMDFGMPELQPQADVHAQKPGSNGEK